MLFNITCILNRTQQILDTGTCESVHEKKVLKRKSSLCIFRGLGFPHTFSDVHALQFDLLASQITSDWVNCFSELKLRINLFRS